MKFRQRVLLLLMAALTFLPAANALSGGGIAGTVADPSGGLIPDVVVSARSPETGIEHKTTTNAVGFFAFPALPAGQYELEVRQSGFEPYRAAVTLESNAALRVDIQLKIQAQSDAMTVTELAAQVETAGTQMGETIAARQVAGIPVNGRSYTDLLALQPGVMPATSQQPNAVVMSGCTSAPPSGDLNPGNLSVSGQRETANGFMVNGSTAQEDFNMGAAIVPNLDSIREFRVLTSNFDAEYGNFSGGQVLVTTKSGTNELHGSGFEFLRNTALDARSFFAADRAQFDRNQFGGTIGGPIRKDRVFFFADYQGARMTQGVDTGLISVPSLANRSGDFSANANALSGTVNGQYWAGLLSQRLGYGVSPGEPYYTPGCASSGQCVFPNARIPQRAWSAPSQALLPFVPTPNQDAGTFSTSAYNQKLRDDKGAFKIDAATRWGCGIGLLFLRRLPPRRPVSDRPGRGKRARIQRHLRRTRAARHPRPHHHPQFHRDQRVAFRLHADRQ